MRRLMTLMMTVLILGNLAAEETLYRSRGFQIGERRVVQGDFTAEALSPHRIVSGYRSGYSKPTGRKIDFKFSLNGGDNERFPGEDHHLLLPEQAGSVLSPVYTFGDPDPEEALIPGSAEPGCLKGDVTCTFRADMRPVLRSFGEKGFYTTRTGEKIDRENFTGVYIAGSTQPLTWNFSALDGDDRWRMTDADGDSVYEATFTFCPYQTDGREADASGEWVLSRDLSGYPRYESPHPLGDALYNLSLEEMLLDIRDDGAFMAGAEWPGVWTRDISYSILLSLAALHPQASMKSLMAKVKNGRIIQDTGTGGSWPVSTDRMVWSLAAWEVYKVTGDREWLRKIFPIIRDSAEDDLQTARDESTGLMRGESSFLDWREQTYPRWMNPRDIYLSLNLGTNAVHYGTYKLLAEMADLLGEDGSRYTRIAQEIKEAMNRHLWMESAGYYGQYLYGRNALSLSPRSETLGEALAVLLDIAEPDRQKQIVENTPVMDFGAPCIYPQIPGIPPYHNRGIWPFVVSYWSWASAKAGNARSVEHGLASLIRASALFLTNKENMVAETGDYMGTEINSDRQLWSVAGNLAAVYRVFFGMDFQADALVFRPFIPEVYGGRRSLENFTYRDAVLDMEIRGSGSRIRTVTLDGQVVDEARIPATLTGRHALVIRMAGDSMEGGRINLKAYAVTPETPVVSLADGSLSWDAIDGVLCYRVFRNGNRMAETDALSYAVERSGGYAEYQVSAVDSEGLASFLSEPVPVMPGASVMAALPELSLEQEHAGYTGEGYLTLHKDRAVDFQAEIPEAGTYRLDCRYANGNGPINTNNRCAIRSLFVDGKRAGALVFPQRGDRLWNDWGFTNGLRLSLTRGSHRFTLRMTGSDENMNGDDNVALLDAVRLIRLPGAE